MGNVRDHLEATEVALAQGEERFRLLVEGMRDYAIFMLDTTGRIMSWNAGAEQIKGYTHEEIVGRHFSIFYPEEDRAAHKPERELQIAVAEGGYEEEGWRLRKDGTRFWASVVITPLYGREGALSGFGKVTRDLSDRRAAEEHLRRSEQVHRLMVDRVRDYAIFMLDTGGHVMTWNAGAERIKGYRADEVIGRHFSIFYTAEDKAADKPGRKLEIAIAVGKYEEEGWRVRRDGTLFWASVVITALRDETGRLRGFGKVTRDLTERRRFEESLQEKNAELERALLAKDRFLASMSHELRTPLNAIIGYTGTLLMRLPGPLNPEQEKQLRTVQGGARHLLSLINDLLDLAKINSGTIEIRHEPVAIRRVVEDVVTTLRPFASEKGIELTAIMPPEEIDVATDRRALSQILLNLCNNACKFTPRGSVRIEVERGEAPGRALIFRVSDTGIGIRAEDQARLFLPFVQLGREGGGDRNGSGLGLHLSRRLADLLGGRITVESEYGRGSRFTLTLGEN